MNMKKGFTLIEVMIVVAILAILAAIAIPNFMTYRKESQKNACKANMKQILAACEAYTIKNNAKPELASLTATDKGAFLKKLPTCPAGGSYTLTADANDKDGKTISTVTCSSNVTGYKHELD